MSFFVWIGKNRCLDVLADFGNFMVYGSARGIISVKALILLKAKTQVRGQKSRSKACAYLKICQKADQNVKTSALHVSLKKVEVFVQRLQTTKFRHLNWLILDPSLDWTGENQRLDVNKKEKKDSEMVWLALKILYCTGLRGKSSSKKLCLRYALIKSKLQHPPPPRANLGHLTVFLCPGSGEFDG